MSANPSSQPLIPPPLPARRSQPHVSGSILDSKRPSQSGQAKKDRWATAPDPRASSTQSLCSDVSAHEQRRTLLLIYIHGFYGNKQSFRSFPHHVHSYLRSSLTDTHVIHSKIYPRYKTYRAIEVARDNFSEWLIPHESSTTDVILVGHSMGGILAAEIVLMPNRHPYRSHPYKHRILGTISLDSPFLGLHPGIIVAGISSLFQSAPDPAAAENQDGSSPVASPADAPPMQSPNRRQTNDPYFDPPFWNDTPFREAPFVKRIMNFTKKHRSEGIVNATANHIVSHLEYGGCLADYPGLRRRYDRIRALEDVDELQMLASESQSGGGGGGAAAENPPPTQVRFVNYYTLSSGRPAKPKPPTATSPHGITSSQSSIAPTASLYTLTSTADSTLSREESHQRSSVSISIQDYGDSKEPVDPKTALSQANDEKQDEKVEHGNTVPETQPTDSTAATSAQGDFSRLSMQNIDPIPMPDADYDVPVVSTPTPTPTPIPDYTEGLPPVPDSPIRPADPDLDHYTDKDARKQVEREHRRQVKTYEKAIKDRNRAILEREKLIEKRRKKAQAQLGKDKDKNTDKVKDSDGSSISSVKSDDLTDTQQQQLLAWQQQVASQKERGESASLAETASTTPFFPPVSRATTGATDSQVDGQVTGEEKQKKKKQKKKKFCTVPSKEDGAGDPTWVDVYMDGMDEVGAHCGLFFTGPHYDKLVGDVASRVIGWVQDDMTKRAIMDLQREDTMA